MAFSGTLGEDRDILLGRGSGRFVFGLRRKLWKDLLCHISRCVKFYTINWFCLDMSMDETLDCLQNEKKKKRDEIEYQALVRSSSKSFASNSQAYGTDQVYLWMNAVWKDLL